MSADKAKENAPEQNQGEEPQEQNEEQQADSTKGQRQSNKKKDPIRVECIKRRQWHGKLFHKGETLTIIGGVPKGYEEFFREV